jgi:hypothetical protein
LKELFTLAREPTGNELLNLLKHHKNLVKTEKTTLLIKNKLYMAYHKFFKEFTMTKTNEENDFVQIQFDTEIFNNLILLATIILNDNMKNEAERSLQSYLEIFFKKLDEKETSLNENKTKDIMSASYDCDEDLSSQYSTLSSFLGLHVKKLFIFIMIILNYFFKTKYSHLSILRSQMENLKLDMICKKFII